MSQEALSALRGANSLAQTLTFEQLEEYHVFFDELTGESTVEDQLAYWSTHRGCVALVGDSGAGKSSVMAAVLGALSESVPANLVPTRIPVELADEGVITTVEGFGRHVVSHVINWAAPETLSEKEQESLERQLAETERRTGRTRRAGFSLGTGRLLPVDVRISGDLTGASQDFERQLGSGDVARAMKRLVAMFRARDLEPFFIFDDTDAWLRLPGQEARDERLVAGFFGTNVRMLTRELDCGFVLAVHRSYAKLPVYQQVVDSLEAIDIPTFPNPRAAITEILKRRMKIDGLPLSVDDAFDTGALEALAAIYCDAPDLRRVMAVAGLAVRKAHDDPDAVIVTEAAVFAARTERDTVRGA